MQKGAELPNVLGICLGLSSLFLVGHTPKFSRLSWVTGLPHPQHSVQAWAQAVPAPANCTWPHSANAKTARQDLSGIKAGLSHSHLIKLAMMLTTKK